MIRRVDADIEYINNWSVWLDFVILARTVLAFSGKHAY
jgi:putative colanic acid biosynthesis UDP-glucose lipid carrier transferase